MDRIVLAVVVVLARITWLVPWRFWSAVATIGGVVVRNATIWTSSPRGILADADLFIRDGKIVAVGPDLSVPSEIMAIDATGSDSVAP